MKQMGIQPDHMEKIQQKDGIGVYRVWRREKSYVLKHFEKPEFRREIECYRILQRLGIPTIPMIASTDEAILLEDLKADGAYRLAVPDDLKDERVLRKIARWYRLLHEKGRKGAAQTGLYSELDGLTRENFCLIGQKTGTAEEPVWHFLDEHSSDLLQKLNEIPKTLTYNDFYYTNLAVARDGTGALMFDYHLMGTGMAASDVRNVTYGLSEGAKSAFLKEYGPVDPQEVLLDQVTSTLTALYTACLRESLPSWAEQELARVKNGSLLTRAQALLL